MFRYWDLLLNVLIQQYLGSSKCLIFISDSSHCALNIPLGTLVLNVDVSCNISRLSDMFFRNFGCDSFILNVAEPSKIFPAIEEELRGHSAESFDKRKYVIFAVDIAEDDFKIFTTQSIRFVSDVLLVRLDRTICSQKPLLRNYDHVEVSFWTHRYAGVSNNNKPFMLDKWFSVNESFKCGKRLLYDKLKNQQGRPIRVGTFALEPYVIIDMQTRKMSGIEMNLLKNIIKHINATMDIVIQKDLWGCVYPNGTSYGLRGQLVNDRVDVGAAGFYMNKLSRDQFDMTNVHVMAEITCLVPAPRLAAAWLSPFYGFSLNTWMVLLLTHVLLGFSIYFISYYHEIYQNNDDIKNRPKSSKIRIIQQIMASVAKPLISQPITKQDYYFKPMLCAAMVAALAISAAYNAGFATVMTRPIYLDSIETLEDFLDSDIPWGTVEMADWIGSWQNDTEEDKYERAGERYVALTEEQAVELSKKGRFAFKMERISGKPHIDRFIKEDVIDNYRVMKDTIHTEFAVILLRKHSILLPLFNQVISKLLQSGLVDYWTREYAGHEDYAVQSKLDKVNFKTNLKPVFLRLQHVMGAFSFLLLGHLMALVAFIFEMLFNVNIK